MVRLTPKFQVYIYRCRMTRQIPNTNRHIWLARQML